MQNDRVGRVKWPKLLPEEVPPEKMRHCAHNSSRRSFSKIVERADSVKSFVHTSAEFQDIELLRYPSDGLSGWQCRLSDVP